MPVPTRKSRPARAAHSSAAAARTKSLNSSVLDPIITMNAGGIIQSASDSVEQVFGWTATELFGRNVKILIPEPRRSALDYYLDRYRNSDQTTVLQKTRRFAAVRKDGKAIQIELSMSRADLPAHAAPFFIGIVRDVSHQIDIGDSPEERSRLHRLITEQTRALATANLRLQLADRLASLGTLAAGLGHDMNNVLLPVRARLDALEHTGISDAALTHLTAVRRSIGYLQHLSDGLHFLAIDPDGPGVASDGTGTTDLAYWWSQVGALLRKAVPKHVKLTISLPKRLPPVHIAPHWLTQAMLNLIVNAGEALQQGRRQARVRLWASAEDANRSVRLAVTDNGRGMTHAVQRRALDLFFTTKRRSMGTGLGLPLARKVAVRAGGEIEIKSEPGKGTTVTLVLPAVRPGAKGKAPLAPERRTAAISVVDRRAAELITHVLLKAGLHLKSANRLGPRSADFWVTNPTPEALATATRWHKRFPTGVAVLLGPPARTARKKWAALGAVVIDQPDDFEAIRHTLGQALFAA
ncbi:MAG: PAS domain S-box protein [Phycisphaeraceae bacterium]|nr:PAS domain S-box protein [Phycisphaeraceae bacterium]